jgi:hypothetical protein
MLFRTVMSEKWRLIDCHQFYHQWSDKSWCLVYWSVFSKPYCLDIYKNSYKSLDLLHDRTLENPSASALSSDPAFKPVSGVWLAAFSPRMSVIIHASVVFFSHKHHPWNLGLLPIQQYGLCLLYVFKFKALSLKSVLTLLMLITQIGAS